VSQSGSGANGNGRGSGVLSTALGGRTPGVALPSAVDEDFLGEYPILHTFLCQTVGDDSKPRHTSVLTLFVEDAVWKGVLHERQAQLCLWASGDSHRAVLRCMEDRLASGQAEWRKDRSGRR